MKKIVFLCLSIFVLSYTTAYCMTWGEILSQIRLLSNDNNSNSYRYTDAVLLNRANIIQDDISVKTLSIQKRYYINTSTGTAEYRLPSDILKINRVAYAISNTTTTFKKLNWTSVAGQDTAGSNWQTMTGLPLEYYRRGDYIGLKPYPSGAYSGNNFVQLDYSARASSITNSTDIPLNGDYTLYPFHQAIIYGVMALCEYDKGDTQKYTIMQTIYENWLAKMKEIVYTEPDKNVNFVR